MAFLLEFDVLLAAIVTVQACRNNLLQKSSPDIQNVATGDLEHISTVQINDVYMFMGRELEALDAIPAGNILGTCRLY